MELRETLARLRKDHGFSQAELAEELGVTRQAVSRWETGAAAPTTDNLIALSQLFGVTIDELVTGKKPAIAVEAAEELAPPLDIENAAEGPVLTAVMEDAPEEPPSPAARDAPEESVPPETSMKRRRKMVLTAVLVLCLFCGTLLWGTLTNCLILAIDYLFWEVVFLIVGSIIIFVWRKYRQ